MGALPMDVPHPHPHGQSHLVPHPPRAPLPMGGPTVGTHRAAIGSPPPWTSPVGERQPLPRWVPLPAGAIKIHVSQARLKRRYGQRA